MDAEQLAVLTAADEIAAEWVTEMRLSHVLGGIVTDGEALGIESMGTIIKAMLADIEAESVGEVEMSKPARKAISKRTVAMFKALLRAELRETT